MSFPVKLEKKLGEARREYHKHLTLMMEVEDKMLDKLPNSSEAEKQQFRNEFDKHSIKAQFYADEMKRLTDMIRKTMRSD